MKALLLLTLTVLGVLADEELCVGRCTEGFNRNRKCQCDQLCVYYQSCCSDFESTCKLKITRGDVFAQAEDEYEDSYYETTGFPLLLLETAPTMDNDTVETEPLPTVPMETEPMPTVPMETEPLETDPDGVELPVPEDPELPTTDTEPSPGPEEEEDVCSGKPFDAFTDLKNGSIYAFRGKYFYELDEKKVRDGYPKMINDIWGVPGPIDAAFTRINCQGKTYIFKGREYWRFDNGVLDPGYPRNISKGFCNIPNNIDAAVALPAKDYTSSERVYFFKGSQYWEYNFKKQPSLEDCQNVPPSLAFTQYALMQTEDDWSQFFDLIFGDQKSSGTSKAQLIRRGWRGLPNNLDAAVAGRIYLPPEPPSKVQTRRNHRRKSRRNRKKYQLRKRKSWFSMFDWMSEEDDVDDSDTDPDWVMPITKPCNPIQSIYFFKKDKYYRVNLAKKRVDYVYPRYPRPIAQYWLGCKDEKWLK